MPGKTVKRCACARAGTAQARNAEQARADRLISPRRTLMTGQQLVDARQPQYRPTRVMRGSRRV